MSILTVHYELLRCGLPPNLPRDPTKTIPERIIEFVRVRNKVRYVLTIGRTRQGSIDLRSFGLFELGARWLWFGTWKLKQHIVPPLDVKSEPEVVWSPDQKEVRLRMRDTGAGGSPPGPPQSAS